ncbi:leukotoxin LktA family filamentous adhesin [Massilia glaciei]|nr:leukotoxin LktA family filamentous adhesin [Massilia glaciei]
MHWNSRSPRHTAMAVALITAFGGAAGTAQAATPLPRVGLGGPSLQGQAGNLIVPTGATATVLKVNKNVTDITTGTIKGTVGVNAFSHFQVGQKNVVNLHIPSAATALLNLVYDSPILINGIVNGYKDGTIGGNVMFANPHGMIVGASGVLNVGSLTVATPTRQFMDGVIGTDGEVSSVAVTRLLQGEAPNSADGVIRIDGRVNALQSIRLRAAQVDIDGALKAGADVAHQAAFAGSVNTSGLPAAGALVERGGVIEIVADGAATLAGSIDVARRAGAGAGGSATVFGDSVALAAGARIDAAGTDGGGAINLGTMAGADGARVYARSPPVPAARCWPGESKATASSAPSARAAAPWQATAAWSKCRPATACNSTAASTPRPRTAGWASCCSTPTTSTSSTTRPRPARTSSPWPRSRPTATPISSSRPTRSSPSAAATPALPMST